MSQPNLLELEAPIKICGRWLGGAGHAVPKWCQQGSARQGGQAAAQLNAGGDGCGVLFEALPCVGAAWTGAGSAGAAAAAAAAAAGCQ